MKKISLILFVVLSVVALSFTQNKGTLNGKWTLVCFKNFVTEAENWRPSDYSNGSLTFTFEDDGKVGKLQGITTANSVSADYQIDENRIQIKNFGGTKIAEQGWGKDIWRIIGKSNSFYFEEDTFVIRYEADTKGMFFIAAEE